MIEESSVSESLKRTISLLERRNVMAPRSGQEAVQMNRIRAMFDEAIGRNSDNRASSLDPKDELRAKCLGSVISVVDRWNAIVSEIQATSLLIGDQEKVVKKYAEEEASLVEIAKMNPREKEICLARLMTIRKAKVSAEKQYVELIEELEDSLIELQDEALHIHSRDIVRIYDSYRENSRRKSPSKQPSSPRRNQTSKDRSNNASRPNSPDGFSETEFKRQARPYLWKPENSTKEENYRVHLNRSFTDETSKSGSSSAQTSVKEDDFLSDMFDFLSTEKNTKDNSASSVPKSTASNFNFLFESKDFNVPITEMFNQDESGSESKKAPQPKNQRDRLGEYYENKKKEEEKRQSLEEAKADILNFAKSWECGEDGKQRHVIVLLTTVHKVIWKSSPLKMRPFLEQDLLTNPHKIKQAVRKIQMECHPDRNINGSLHQQAMAHYIFQAITHAFEIYKSAAT